MRNLCFPTDRELYIKEETEKEPNHKDAMDESGSPPWLNRFPTGWWTCSVDVDFAEHLFSQCHFGEHSFLQCHFAEHSFPQCLARFLSSIVGIAGFPRPRSAVPVTCRGRVECSVQVTEAEPGPKSHTYANINSHRPKGKQTCGFIDDVGSRRNLCVGC